MSTYICALLLCLAVSAFANTDLDEACSTNDDCPTNSHCTYRYEGEDVCTNNGCFCDAGYFANGNDCLEEKELEDICTDNLQCTATTGGSECSGGGMVGDDTCKCDPDIGTEPIEIDGMTYCYTSKFEGACTDPNQCLAFYFGGAACNGNVCECADGYKISGDRCVYATLGEECEVNPDDVDCDTDKNLVCTQNECECNTNYSWDDAHDTCIHDGATQVGNGAACDAGDVRYDNNGEYCPTSHECKTCPGEPNANTKCLIDADESGASAVTITSTLMVMIGSLYAILV